MKRGGLENIMNFIAAELGRQNVAVVNRRQPPLLPPPLLQILHQRDLIIHINATRRSAYLLVDSMKCSDWKAEVNETNDASALARRMRGTTISLAMISTRV